MHTYDETDGTLIIMIDTTIYDKLSEKELLCYNGIFDLILGDTIEDALIKIETEGKGNIISDIREIQFNQVKQILTKFSETQIRNIIFVGHHPIIECRSKNSKELFKPLNDLKDFFKNISDYIM